MIMKKWFIRPRFPFVYNLIFNKKRSEENEIIYWYLLTELGNGKQFTWQSNLFDNDFYLFMT